MKYVIDLLQKEWNTNADKAEYMICGSQELETILDQNNQISEALKILNENIRESEEEFCCCIISQYSYVEDGVTRCVECKRPYKQNSWERT